MVPLLMESLIEIPSVVLAACALFLAPLDLRLFPDLHVGATVDGATVGVGCGSVRRHF